MNHSIKLDDSALALVAGGMTISTGTTTLISGTQTGPGSPGGPTCPNGPVKDQSRAPSKGPFSL